MTARTVFVGPDRHLTAQIVTVVAQTPKIKITLTSRARSRVRRSRTIVERLIRSGRVIYGVTTGFGRFKDRVIPVETVFELQKNLIRSHSAGVGSFLSAEIVRASLLVRLNSLAQGFSGVRLELLDFLSKLLNANIIPAIPSQGSVGASGDLAPLSHAGLVLMGEGRAWFQGRLMSGREALKRVGLKPFEFAAKEGLAWNNGTAVMTGIAALVVEKAERLATIADIAGALTLEAICGVPDALDHRIHKLRPHPGQSISAANIRWFIRGSRLVGSEPQRIQDAYSVRCMPQVHGACRDAIGYTKQVVERELNSVTDNPLIVPARPYALSGGNFHGEPIAIAMDALGIALAELANISERRIAKLMDPATSEGLPAFLVQPARGGLHSGFMIAQYTAAALVSENKVLAHPASVDSIPTSANQEDHVSMGTIAARKAYEILQNVENVLAIEWLVAAQGIDLRSGGTKLGRGTRAAYSLIRRQVPLLTQDRVLADDIAGIRKILPTACEQVVEVTRVI